MAFTGWFRDWGYGLLDLCFPVPCISCGSIVTTARTDVPLCLTCEEHLPVLSGTLCFLCSKQLGEEPPPPGSQPGAFVCGRCRTSDTVLERTIAGFDYEDPIRTVIHDWKFGGYSQWGKWLGRRLCEQMPDNVSAEWDAVVPIPLRPERKCERGFNQAYQLAEVLSRQCSLPLIEPLVKTRTTDPQAQLSRKQRLENLKGVFSIRSGVSVSGRSILLVDDIYTTGSTLRTAGDVLQEQGTDRLGAVVLARAS